MSYSSCASSSSGAMSSVPRVTVLDLMDDMWNDEKDTKQAVDSMVELGRLDVDGGQYMKQKADLAQSYLRKGLVHVDEISSQSMSSTSSSSSGAFGNSNSSSQASWEEDDDYDYEIYTMKDGYRVKPVPQPAVKYVPKKQADWSYGPAVPEWMPLLDPQAPSAPPAEILNTPLDDELTEEDFADFDAMVPDIKHQLELERNKIQALNREQKLLNDNSRLQSQILELQATVKISGHEKPMDNNYDDKMEDDDVVWVSYYDKDGRFESEFHCEDRYVYSRTNLLLTLLFIISNLFSVGHMVSGGRLYLMAFHLTLKWLVFCYYAITPPLETFGGTNVEGMIIDTVTYWTLYSLVVVFYSSLILFGLLTDRFLLFTRLSDGTRAWRVGRILLNTAYAHRVSMRKIRAKGLLPDQTDHYLKDCRVVMKHSSDVILYNPILEETEIMAYDYATCTRKTHKFIISRVLLDTLLAQYGRESDHVLLYNRCVAIQQINVPFFKTNIFSDTAFVAVHLIWAALMRKGLMSEKDLDKCLLKLSNFTAARNDTQFTKLQGTLQGMLGQN